MAFTQITGDPLNALAPGWQLLATATASASATVDFDSGIDYTKYENVIIIITNVIPATDDNELAMRFDYGAGYLATNYQMAGYTVNTAGTANSRAAVTTFVTVIGDDSAGWGIGNAADERACGTVCVYQVNDATSFTSFISDYTHDNAATTYRGFSGGRQETSGAIVGIRLLMGGGGNITSGKFKLYGVA